MAQPPATGVPAGVTENIQSHISHNQAGTITFNGGRHAAVHLEMGQRYAAPRQGGKPHDRWQGRTARRQLPYPTASTFDPGNLDEYGNFFGRRHRTDGLSPVPAWQSIAEHRAQMLIQEQEDSEELKRQIRESRRQDLQTAFKEQKDLEEASPVSVSVTVAPPSQSQGRRVQRVQQKSTPPLTVSDEAVQRMLARQRENPGTVQKVKMSSMYASLPRPKVSVSGKANRMTIYNPPQRQLNWQQRQRPAQTARQGNARQPMPPQGRQATPCRSNEQAQQQQRCTAMVRPSALAQPVSPSESDGLDSYDACAARARKAAEAKRKSAKNASCKRHRATVGELRHELMLVRRMAETTRDLLLPVIGEDKWSEIQSKIGQAQVAAAKAAAAPPARRPYVPPELSSDEEEVDSDAHPRKRGNSRQTDVESVQPVVVNQSLAIEDYVWAPYSLLKWVISKIMAIIWSLAEGVGKGPTYKDANLGTKSMKATQTSSPSAKCECAECDCSYEQGQHPPLCDECHAHASAGDVCICDCHNCHAPEWEATWATSSKTRNRLAHATNGNTSIVKRVFLEGAPVLDKEATGLDQFLLWTIDLKAFCETMGLTEWIVGPEPTLDNSTTETIKAKHKTSLAEGLRYLCAMIGDKDLRAGVALNADSNGVKGFKYLKEEFLQGQSVQSQYLSMLQNMRLQQSGNVVVFRNQWQKTVSQLLPVPSDSILCEMFVQSITMDTGSFYDNCLDQDLDRSDYAKFSRKLTQLCQKRKDRVDNKAKADEGHGIAGGTAMKAAIERTVRQVMDKPGGRNRNDRQQKGGLQPSHAAIKFGSPNKDPCVRCGKRGHTRKDCNQPMAKCQFRYPDGSLCGGDHLEEFCWAKHPELCKLPKVKAAIMQRLGKGKGQKPTKAKSAYKARASHQSRWQSDTESDESEEESGNAVRIVYPNSDMSDGNDELEPEPSSEADEPYSPSLQERVCLPCRDEPLEPDNDVGGELQDESEQQAHEWLCALEDKEAQEAEEWVNSVFVNKCETLCSSDDEEAENAMEAQVNIDQWYLRDETQGIIDIPGHLVEVQDSLIVDTGASDHIICDKRCIIQPEHHRPTRIRIRTGNDVSKVTSVGPASFIVNDDTGQAMHITRRVLFIEHGFSANLWSVPLDYDAHSTKTEFEPANRITLANGTIIPFRRDEKRQYVLDYLPPTKIVNAVITCTDTKDHATALVSASGKDTWSVLNLWHKRMGHCSATVICKLPDCVTNVPHGLWTRDDAKTLNKECKICPMAKMKAAGHPNNRVEPKKGKQEPRVLRDQLHSEFGQRVDMDLAGPLPESLGQGYRYTSLFLDDGTDSAWVYFCVRKKEQKDLHLHFQADTKRYGEVKEYHSDNGGEYVDKEYLQQVLQEGASRTFTVPYTPNLNNKAEGMFWRLFCVARALLFESGMPTVHWPYAIQHAVYIMQRTPMKRIINGEPVWKTPYENLNNRKPDSQHLRVWGCQVSSEIPRHERKKQGCEKLSKRAETGWYMGRSRKRKAYIIFLPDPATQDLTKGQYVERRSVVFAENITPRTITDKTNDKATPSTKTEDGSKADSDDDVAEQTSTPPPPPRPRPTVTLVEAKDPGLCQEPGCTLPFGHDLGHSFERGGGQGLPSSNLRRRTAMLAGVGGSVPTKQFQLASGERLIWANSACRFDIRDAMFATNVLDNNDIAEALSATNVEEEIKALVAKQKTFRNEGDGSFHIRSVPKGFRDVLKTEPEEKAKWVEAMQEELNSHIKNETWILIPAANVPANRRRVGATWTYDLKRDPDGRIKRWKARLCAQGFTQEEGIDYFETYSNTIRYETLRMILAIAALHDLYLSSIDIKTAYLNGLIEDDLDIYMTPPRGFTFKASGKNPTGLATYSDSFEPDKDFVCLLKKAIYGLKQSGRRWETCFWDKLRELGATQSDIDPCLWRLQEGENFILIAIYVDDVVFATNSRKFRNGVVDKLQEAFDVVDQGDLTWIFGTAIKQDMVKGTVELHQRMYIEDLVQQYSPGKEKGRSIPCTSDVLDLETPNEEGVMLHPQYRTIIGQLMWISIISRPDISFAVSFLARFNSRGTQAHFDSAVKVVNYLNVTKDKKIIYHRDCKGHLTEHILAHSELKEYVFDKDTIVTFSDSSHGGERPMAGYVGYLADSPFAWSAFRLPVTPLSSCQGEYHTATKAAVMAKAYSDLMTFTGYPSAAGAPIFCDNRAAVLLSDSGISSKKLRHVATHIAFLRELIKSNDIMLLHISTKGQIADIFTKPLAASTFHELRVHLTNS